ncbi:ester cyclase [Nocardia sp. NPDC004722]
MTTPALTDLLDPRPELVRPGSLTVDGGLEPERARHLVRIAQTLYTFWHTGATHWLDEAVEPTFTDNTLPPGRPQGIDGPRTASTAFRAAVPDLTCELADLIVAGDKLAVRLHFRGHFTGIYNGIRGQGEPIDFIAFDIQKVGPDRIVEDWHLEDNLTFLSQAGLVTTRPAP